jgi:hypothetical protein
MDEQVRAEIAAFDALEGDLFDWKDNPETLSHKTALSALRELVAECDLDSMAIVGIDAWRRKEVVEIWKESAAKCAVYGLLEAFDEAYGAFDSGTDLPDAVEAELRAKARELVDLFVDRVPVYQCEKADGVVLSRSAVRAILEREGLS